MPEEIWGERSVGANWLVLKTRYQGTARLKVLIELSFRTQSSSNYWIWTWQTGLSHDPNLWVLLEPLFVDFEALFNIGDYFKWKWTVNKNNRNFIRK